MRMGLEIKPLKMKGIKTKNKEMAHIGINAVEAKDIKIEDTGKQDVEERSQRREKIEREWIRKRYGSTAAAVAVLLAIAIPVCSYAEGIGPGEGLPGNGISQEKESGPAHSSDSQTAERQISPNAFKKVNGQYLNMYGDTIPGALYRGVSVSKYQGEIDWHRAAADDITFAIARIGYLDSPDPYFDRYMKGAAEAGLKTGVYLYSQANTVEKAEAEARYAVRLAKDYKISYPIAMDVESNSIGDISKQELTDIINAFCKIVQDSGFHPIVFSYNQWLVNRMDTAQIPYDIWYARYGTIHEYPNRTIWQCTEEGRVDGINGNVCIEMAFKDYSQVIPSEGWKCVDGNWYYFKDYQKYMGWQELDGKRYYLNPANDGIMAAGNTLEIDGTAYTFGSDGAVQ
ncbi:GH25 family lysozyme [Lachnospiraceae bacterium 62-35]